MTDVAMTTLGNCPAMTYCPLEAIDWSREERSLDDLMVTQIHSMSSDEQDNNTDFNVLLTMYQEMYHSILREMVAMENLLCTVNAACLNSPLHLPMLVGPSISGERKLSDTSVQTGAAIVINRASQTSCDVIENEADNKTRDGSGAVTSNHVIAAMEEEDESMVESYRPVRPFGQIPPQVKASAEHEAEVVCRNNAVRGHAVVETSVAPTEVNVTKAISVRCNRRASFGNSRCTTTLNFHPTGNRAMTKLSDGKARVNEFLADSAKHGTSDTKTQHVTGRTKSLSHECHLPLKTSTIQVSSDTTCNWSTGHFDGFPKGITDCISGHTKVTAEYAMLDGANISLIDTSREMDLSLQPLASTFQETASESTVSGNYLGDSVAQPEATSNNMVRDELAFDARYTDEMTSPENEPVKTCAAIVNLQRFVRDHNGPMTFPWDNATATLDRRKERKETNTFETSTCELVEHANSVMRDVYTISQPPDSQLIRNTKHDNVEFTNRHSATDEETSCGVNDSASVLSLTRAPVVVSFNSCSKSETDAKMTSRLPSPIELSARTGNVKLSPSTKEGDSNRTASFNDVTPQKQAAANKSRVSAKPPSSVLPFTRSVSVPLTPGSIANQVTAGGSRGHTSDSSSRVLPRCNSATCTKTSKERPRQHFWAITAFPRRQPQNITPTEKKPTCTRNRSNKTGRPFVFALTSSGGNYTPSHTQSEAHVGDASYTPPSTEHVIPGDDLRPRGSGSLPDVTRNNAIHSTALRRSTSTRSCEELISSRSSKEHATCCSSGTVHLYNSSTPREGAAVSAQKQHTDSAINPRSSRRVQGGSALHRGKVECGTTIGGTPDTRAHRNTAGRGRPSAIPVGKYRTTPAAAKRVPPGGAVPSHHSKLKPSVSGVRNYRHDVIKNVKCETKEENSPAGAENKCGQWVYNSSSQRPSQIMQPPTAYVIPGRELIPPPQQVKQPNHLLQQPVRGQQQPFPQLQQPLQQPLQQLHKHRLRNWTQTISGNAHQQQPAEEQQLRNDSHKKQQQCYLAEQRRQQPAYQQLKTAQQRQQQQLHKRQQSLQLQKEKHIQLQQQHMLLQRKQQQEQQHQLREPDQQQQQHSLMLQQQQQQHFQLHKPHTSQLQKLPRTQDYSYPLHQRHLHQHQTHQHQQHLHHQQENEEECQHKFVQYQLQKGQEDKSGFQACLGRLLSKPPWQQQHNPHHVMTGRFNTTHTATNEQEATTMKYLVTQLVCNLRTVAKLEDKITTLEQNPFPPHTCQKSSFYPSGGVAHSCSLGGAVPFYAGHGPVGIASPMQATFGVYAARFQFASLPRPCRSSQAPTPYVSHLTPVSPSNIHENRSALEYYSPGA